MFFTMPAPLIRRHRQRGFQRRNWRKQSLKLDESVAIYDPQPTLKTEMSRLLSARCSHCYASNLIPGDDFARLQLTLIPRINFLRYIASELKMSSRKTERWLDGSVFPVRTTKTIFGGSSILTFSISERMCRSAMSATPIPANTALQTPSLLAHSSTTSSRRLELTSSFEAHCR